MNWLARAVILLGAFVTFASYRWVSFERGLGFVGTLAGTAIVLAGLYWSYRTD